MNRTVHGGGCRIRTRMALRPVDFKSTALPVRANPPDEKQFLVHGSWFVDHPASTQIVISNIGEEMQGKTSGTTKV